MLLIYLLKKLINHAIVMFIKRYCFFLRLVLSFNLGITVTMPQFLTSESLAMVHIAMATLATHTRQERLLYIFYGFIIVENAIISIELRARFCVIFFGVIGVVIVRIDF